MYLKKQDQKNYNPSKRLYVNKKENRIMFKIKARYNLEHLTPESMKLFGSTKSKITKNDNVKNLLY